VNGPEAIGTVGALLTLVKQIRPLIDGVTNKELNERLLEFQQKLLDLQIDLAELNQANLALQTQVVGLQGQLEIKEKLSYDGHVYWSNRDGKKDGPFCPLCWDKDKHLVHLSKRHIEGQAPYGYCTLHETDFNISGHQSFTRDMRPYNWIEPDETD
jgi:hypothetical protein